MANARSSPISRQRFHGWFTALVQNLRHSGRKSFFRDALAANLGFNPSFVAFVLYFAAIADNGRNESAAGKARMRANELRVAAISVYMPSLSTPPTRLQRLQQLRRRAKPHLALRISEILALRWQDIDLFGEPKSEASKAPVPLHPILAEQLNNWHSETLYAQDQDFVFPSLKLRGRKPPRANMLVNVRRAALEVGIKAAPPVRSAFTLFGERWLRC